MLVKTSLKARKLVSSILPHTVNLSFTLSNSIAFGAIDTVYKGKINSNTYKAQDTLSIIDALLSFIIDINILKSV
jgi:hypothetical protein